MDRVVYRSAAGRSADEIVRLLRARGLSPRVLDDPNPNPVVQYAAKGTYRVRIAVPLEQAARAVEVLRESEMAQASQISGSTTELRRQILAGAVLGNLVLGAYCLMSGVWRELNWESLCVLPIGGVVGGTIVVSNLARFAGKPDSGSDQPKSPWLRRFILVALSILVLDWSFHFRHQPVIEEDDQRNVGR